VNKFLRHLAKVFLHTHILNDFKSSQPLDVVKALAMCQKMLGVVTSELLLVEVRDYCFALMNVVQSVLSTCNSVIFGGVRIKPAFKIEYFHIILPNT